MENRRCDPGEMAREIIATAIDGFCMIDPATVRLLDTNDAYARMVGYTKEELLSMSIFDLEAAEKPEETKEYIARIVASGGDRFESRHRTKDGRTIDVEVSARYLDIDGGRIVAFLRDITDRRRGEEQLRASAGELQRLNKVMMGREMRIIELKREVAELKAKAGQP